MKKGIFYNMNNLNNISSCSVYKENIDTRVEYPCPRCYKKAILDIGMVLTSSSPMYKGTCKHCDNVFYVFCSDYSNRLIGSIVTEKETKRKPTYEETTKFMTVEQIIEDKDSCPLDIGVIPNYMGINLCSVLGIRWKELGDGQLTSLEIVFVPNYERK